MPIKGLDKVREALDDLETDLNDKTRAVIFQGLANVQIGTPVDTGRARNNWFLSQTAPSTKSVKAVSGNDLKDTDIPDQVLGKRFFFTNNLPYIEELEYGGHSQQAPYGWVRSELLRMKQRLRNI